MAGYVLLAWLVPLLAVAADREPEPRYDLHIPALKAGAALELLARQTNAQLLFPYDLVKSIDANGVSGRMTLSEALSKLLQGTGLYSSVTTARVITITTSIAGVKQTGEQAVSKSNNWSFLGAIAAFLASAAHSARADEQPSPATSATLEEIVVTAQKREERLQNVPISMSVLTSEALDRSTVQGVSEALNAVPGVATTSTYIGGGTNIQIRGVGASFPLFTGSSAVAYYLDSVPFGLVKSAVGPDANAYDLSRVEVLRGPQGTLYGASALNGVVRVLTNDANLQEFDIKARGSGSVTQGGSGNYRADATLNAPIVQDKLAARATIGYQHDSGWIDQPNNKNANYTHVGTYRLKLNAQPTQDLSVALFAWRSKQNSGAPDLGHTYHDNASLLSQPTSTVYDAYGMKVGYQLPWFLITSATSYLDYENDSILGLDVPGFDIPGSTYFTQLKSHVASEEVNLTSSTDGPWRWSMGGIYRHGTEDLFEAFTVIPFPPPTSVDASKSYAVYGEITRLLFENRLEVTGGVRHFHDELSQHGDTGPGTPLIYGSNTAEANTPRGVVTWHAAEHLLFYTSYSQGFRSGFPQQTSVLVALPQFPAVNPDRLRNYEVGTKGSALGGRLAFEASVYHMDWNAIQLLLAVPVNGLPYPGVVNGARAKGNGVDISMAIQLAEGLSISPYVSWNDLAIRGDVLSGGTTLYRDGDRPSGSPSTTAGVSTTYAFPLGSGGARGSVSASVNYISPLAYRSATATGILIQSSNSEVVSHLNLAVDFQDHWTLRLYGDNLNNWHGTTAVMFAGVVPDWQARIRPLTVGLQAEYHLH